MSSLILFLVVATILLLGSSSSTLALDATRASSSVWRSESKVDVFLRVKTDDERRDVHNLLSNAKNSQIM